MNMHLSDEGIALIHSFESLELVAYPDPNSPLGAACANRGLVMRKYRNVPNWEQMHGDPWTIGWGHTGPDVFEGLVWSQGLAERAFAADIVEREGVINEFVRVMLTQGQFDAMVSILYNVGFGSNKRDGIIRLKDGRPSTLLRLLNAGRYDDAAKQFLLWISRGTSAERGLTRRRRTEVERFYGRPWRGVA